MPAVCEYGAQPQTGAPAYVWLTAGVVRALLEDDATWLAPGIALIAPQPVSIAELCANPPSDPPPWDPFLVFSPVELVVWLTKWSLAKLWRTYCE